MFFWKVLGVEIPLPFLVRISAGSYKHAHLSISIICPIQVHNKLRWARLVSVNKYPNFSVMIPFWLVFISQPQPQLGCQRKSRQPRWYAQLQNSPPASASRRGQPGRYLAHGGPPHSVTSVDQSP